MKASKNLWFNIRRRSCWVEKLVVFLPTRGGWQVTEIRWLGFELQSSKDLRAWVRKKVLPSWKVSGWFLPSNTPLEEWRWWWHLDTWDQSTPDVLFSSVCKTDWDYATSGNHLKSAAICLEFDWNQNWMMGFYLSKGGCKQMEHLDTCDVMWLHCLSI